MYIYFSHYFQLLYPYDYKQYTPSSQGTTFLFLKLRNLEKAICCILFLFGAVRK